jgi:serine phosphatase RsbU (regulator of sigma subunit)
LTRSLLLDSAPEAAFDRITSLVTVALGVPVALISLVDDRRQFFKSSVGLPEPWCSARQTPLSHSFCKVVAATEAPLIISDARRDPELAASPAIPDLGVVAYAGMPIRFEGETLGSLCAIDHEPRAWREDDLAVLRGLADVVEEMIVLRLASLGSERLQAERVAALDAVASVNRRLQRALLPRPAAVAFDNFTVTSVYEPGARGMLLGGDFADVRETDDGGLDFVIGDVTGHGPEAAALGAALRTTWNALRGAGTPLEEVTSALNAALIRERSEEGLMATTIVGSIDAAGAVLRLAVAGHPPPVLVGDPSRALEVGVGRGVLLGWRDDATWTVAEVPVAGWSVLVYTDGVTEARTLAGTRDGEDLLIDAASEWARRRDGGALPIAIVRGAEQANGGPLDDDVAILHIVPST